MAHKIEKKAGKTAAELNKKSKKKTPDSLMMMDKGALPEYLQLSMSYDVAVDYQKNVREELKTRLEMFCPQILHTPDQTLGNETNIPRYDDQASKNPNFSSISTTFAKSAANVFNSDLLSGYGNAFELRLNPSIKVDEETRDEAAKQVKDINETVAHMIDNSNYEETRQLFLQQLVACGSTASMIRYIKDDLHFSVIPIIDLYITFPDDIGESQIHFPMTRKVKEWKWYYLNKDGKVPEEIAKLDEVETDGGRSKNLTLIHTQWPVWIPPNKKNKLKKGVTKYYHIVWSKELNMIVDSNKVPSISKFFCFASINATPKNPYGCGVAYEIENDIQILDHMKRQSLQALEQVSNPTYLVDEGKLKLDNNTNIQPGDFIYTDGDPNTAATTIQSQAFPQAMFAEIARLEQNILSRYISNNEVFSKPGVTATAVQQMMAEFVKQRQMDSKAVGNVIRDEFDVALSVLHDNLVIPMILESNGEKLIPLISNHTLSLTFKGFMSEMLMVESMRKFLAFREQIPPQMQAMIINYAQQAKEYIKGGGDPDHFVDGWEDILKQTVETIQGVGAPQDLTGLENVQGPVLR